MSKALSIALCFALAGVALGQNAKPDQPVPVPVQIQAPGIQIQPGGIQIQIDPAVPVQFPAQPGQDDLQKQIEDALKELDKLKDAKPEDAKKVVDDVQKKLRQQIIARPPIIINGIGGGGGIVGPIGGVIGGPIARLNQNRIGILAQRPVPVLVQQLKLPEGKGMVVADVVPESAAAKAGLKKFDIILEIDGKSVSSDLPTFQKELREFKTDADVKVIVMREGIKEAIKSLKMPEAKDEPVIIRPGGVIRPLPVQPGVQIVPPGGVGFGGGAGAGFLPVIPPNGGAAAGGFGGVGGVIKVQAGNANGNGESLAVAISDKEFSIQSTSGANKTTIKGTRAAGVSTPTEIVVQEGETSTRAASVADLPERLRAGVNKLLENVK